MSLTQPQPNSLTAPEITVGPPVTAVSREAVGVPEKSDGADASRRDQDAALEPGAPVPPPDRTLRLTFTLRLEDDHEVLLEIAETLDFEHTDQAKSIALVGDEVRNWVAISVVGPLLTTANKYVREKLDAAQPKVCDAVKNSEPPFPEFPPLPPPKVAAPENHPFSGGGNDHP